MAKKVQTVLIDDVTGEQADVTIQYAFEGVTYSIDLTNANADKFREALAPWVEKSRRSGGRRTRVATASRPGLSRRVRAWCAKQGREVNSRGRIPADVMRDYFAAHPEEA